MLPRSDRYELIVPVDRRRNRTQNLIFGSACVVVAMLALLVWHRGGTAATELSSTQDSDVDTEVDSSCKTVKQDLGKPSLRFVALHLNEEGHCSGRDWKCHDASEQIENEETFWVRGKCHGSSKVWAVHFGLVNSYVPALQDPVDGDPEATFDYCADAEPEMGGKQRSQYDKLRCKYEVIQVTGADEESLAFPLQLASKLNKNNAGWKAALLQEQATMTKTQYQQSKYGQLGDIDLSEEHKAGLPKLFLTQLTTIPDTYNFHDLYPSCVANGIRNQGSCGSCYAFASNCAYSLTLCKMSNLTNNVDLSQQQAVSCYKDNGCGGGSALSLWSKQESNNGFYVDSCAPYLETDADGHQSKSAVSCTDSKQNCASANTKWEVSSSSAVQQKDWKQTLINYGPIYVRFTYCPSWGSYKSGIYKPISGESCSGGHAVTLIGWGPGYWLVQNSWGSSWGNNGLIKMSTDVETGLLSETGYMVVPKTLTCTGKAACENGGSYKSDCSGCNCPAKWGGDTCSTCAASCQNGGALDSASCTCTCAQGYFGNLCEHTFKMSWETFDWNARKATWKVSWSLSTIHPTQNNVVKRYSNPNFNAWCPSCGTTKWGNGTTGSVTTAVSNPRGRFAGRPDYEHCFQATVWLGNNEFGVSKGYEKVQFPCFYVRHNTSYATGKCIDGGEPITDTSHALYHAQCHTPTPPDAVCANNYGGCPTWAGMGECATTSIYYNWMVVNCRKACKFCS